MLIKPKSKKFWTYTPSWGATASAPPPVGFSLAFAGSATSGATGPTISYGSITLPAGFVVAANLFETGATAAPISSITVGGLSLAQTPGAFATSGAENIGSDVWQSSELFAGGSAEVSVTYGEAINPFGTKSSIALYSLTTTTPTPASVKIGISDGGSNIATISSFVVPSGGGGVVLTAGGNQTPISSVSNTTIDVTQTANQIYGHASSTGTLSITTTSAADQGIALTGVSWGP